MISKITLKNFKAFEEIEIEFRPITLFLGPNNSGKSSILAALRILVQTVESYDPQVPILLNGVMGDFGTYRDVVFDNSPRRHIHISVSFSNQRQIDPWYDPGRLGDTNNEIHVHYDYRSRRREIILKAAELWQGGDFLLSTNYSEDSERQSINKIGSITIPSALKSSISRGLRMQNFIPGMMPGGLIRRSKKDEETAVSDFLEKNPKVDDFIRRAYRIPMNLHREFRNIEYLGAMRMPPSRTYLFTGERRNRIGANGENAASVLVMDSARGGSRSRRIAESVKSWLSSAGIASDLKVKHISDRHYEIRIQHPVTKEYQNFADVGYGNSQVLPVLIGGFNLSPNSTFMVEEPEIHLHPRAQAELGDYFLELLRRNVQSIVETHSEHLILRLQQHVASGNISPKDIGVYYVHANEGKKCIRHLALDSEGAFIDEWPGGFFPERLEEAKKLSKIRYQKQLSN
jgi:predicted ATPase